MAPLLIDSRGILKLGFLAVVVATFVFSSGFLYGYQQANSQHLASNQIEPLALPINTVSLATEMEQQKPAVIDAGEGIDVDQPEVANESIVDLADTKQLQKPTNEALHTEVASSSLIDERKEIDSVSVDQIKSVLITNKLRNKAKYSVQVGMYRRLTNAELMVAELQGKNLNAYVIDYLNKNNKVRFNVRFGYYADKKTAVTAIKQFRQTLKGDGYLVRYSIDSLMYPTAGEMSAPSLTKDAVVQAVSVPSEAVIVELAEASIVDTVNAPDALNNTQAENLETNLVKKTSKIIYN